MSEQPLNSDTVVDEKPNFTPLTKPARTPLGRSYAAGAAEERRAPTPRKLDKQWTKALDNNSIENERAVAQNDILKARDVKPIHYAGVKKFVESMVRKDTDLDEYKNLINQYLDGILGKPSYLFSPHKWEDWMRGCIANRCMEAGIKNPTNIDQIRDDVLEVAEADGRMGDDTYILDLLKEEIRAFSEQIAELDWRTAPDAFHKFVTEVKAGDFFVRQILGPTVAEWPPVRLEALRLVREAQAAAALDGDGKPIAASVKPDWSAVQKAVKDMGQQAPAAAKEHTMDPAAMVHAVPNHIKRELGLDKNTVGKHVIQAFGMAVDLYIEKFGPVKTWEIAEDHVASTKAAAKVSAAKPVPGSELRAWVPESAAAYDERQGEKPAEVTSTLPDAKTEPPKETVKDSPISNTEATPSVSSVPTKPDTQPIENDAPVTDIPKPEKKILEFTPAPVMAEIKTLMGVPIGDLPSVLNRKYHQKAYKQIKAKNGDDHWTDIDPISVRKRFDKVFGPQGFGWRLVPAAGVGRVETSAVTKTSKAGREYTEYSVNFVAFQFEYALLMPDGKIQYIQTSAFSDSDENEDQGYAYRGAFSSLMKQALKMFGGFDHFADKTA